jgi:hypothetical protein
VGKAGLCSTTGRSSDYKFLIFLLFLDRINWILQDYFIFIFITFRMKVMKNNPPGAERSYNFFVIFGQDLPDFQKTNGGRWCFCCFIQISRPVLPKKASSQKNQQSINLFDVVCDNR